MRTRTSAFAAATLVALTTCAHNNRGGAAAVVRPTPTGPPEAASERAARNERAVAPADAASVPSLEFEALAAGLHASARDAGAPAGLIGRAVSWRMRVFNIESVPAVEHPDPARRHAGRMRRVLLMSRQFAPGTSALAIPDEKLVFVACLLDVGVGADSLARGQDVTVTGTVWTIDDSNWVLVYLRDYRVQSP